jgi:hypothetical protein
VVNQGSREDKLATEVRRRRSLVAYTQLGENGSMRAIAIGAVWAAAPRLNWNFVGALAELVWNLISLEPIPALPGGGPISGCQTALPWAASKGPASGSGKSSRRVQPEQGDAADAVEADGVERAEVGVLADPLMGEGARPRSVL